MLLNFIKNLNYKIRKNNAQATVEAAIMIPVIFLILLLLIQPAILLYDLCVMNSASAETCRVLGTCNEVEKQKVCEPFAKRRLGAIPQQDNFHLHSTGCSYEVFLEGSQETPQVKVSIKNQIKPLPIIGFLSQIFGLLNSNGCFEITAQVEEQSKPAWAQQSYKDTSVDKWVGRWLK